MTAAPRQLPLSLEFRPALGRSDFLVSPANAEAVRQLSDWPGWPGRRMALVGPARSGKTHLVHVWMQDTGAERTLATDLDERAAARLAGRGKAVVEDVDALPSLPAARRREAERALFHLCNLAAADGAWLLLTGRDSPARWAIETPDLASRLSALPVVRLSPPDDVLLSSIMVKLCADRQLRIGPDVVRYLTRRIERSFAAVETVVSALDRYSLASKRPVSRAIASAVLADVAAED